MAQKGFSVGGTAKLLAGLCLLGLASAPAYAAAYTSVIWGTGGNSGTGALGAVAVSVTTGANGNTEFNGGWSTDPASDAGSTISYTSETGDTLGTPTGAASPQTVTFGAPVVNPILLFNFMSPTASIVLSGVSPTVVSASNCSLATLTITCSTLRSRSDGIAVQLTGTFTTISFTYADSSGTATNGFSVALNPISPQTITFTTNAPLSSAYGSSFTVAATGGGSGNPVTFTSSGSCTNSGATYTMTSGTGTCSVIANQAGSTTYSAALTVMESVAATKAVLTVTATSFTQPYGKPIPVLTYSFNGFVSPDTASVVTGAPMLTTTATVSSLPGVYPITITQGTLAAANYTFSLVNGTLTVTLPVGPGQCVPFPVTLAAPAGPYGAAVTLTSSNPSIADFSPGLNPIVVIIPAGATSPQRGEIPQICGVNFGTVTVTAAPGVTTTSQTVTVPVSATLSFAFASSTVTAGRQDRLELDLSAPAPAPGLTVNLSSDNTAKATVPATIVIPANQTSVIVPVTGVATGTTTIHASTTAPNVPPTTTSITVQ